jgi:putative peptidoglycan lipid II flippase
MGLAGVLAKLAFTFKELIVARIFGRGDVLDAFLIALVLPSFIVNLLMGALSTAILPILVRARQKLGVDAAEQLVSNTMLMGGFALAVVAIPLGALAKYYLPYLGSNFSAEKLQLTCQLIYVLLPFTVFSGIATLASGILNARERFVLPGMVPVLTPLVTICFILAVGKAWGPFALAGGAVAGSFLEAGLLVHAIKASGIRVRLQWNGLNPLLGSVMQQFIPALCGAFMMGSTAIVDQSMAAMLAGGSVAALSFAGKITAAIVAVGGAALSTAAFPYLSTMVAEHDWQGCQHTLKRYSVLVAVVAVPFTLLLIAFSRPLVGFLFQRGAFTSADTALVSWIQICYALQIPFYLLGLLFVRFLSAAGRNYLIMYVAGINLVVDIVLNLVLMRVWGVAGIALSTSLVYLTSFLMVFTCSIRVLIRERSTEIAKARAQEAIR